MRRLLRACVAVVLLALSVTACGNSGSGDVAKKYAKVAPATIDQDMRTALAGLKSVHVHTVESDSGSTFLIDISVDSAGRCEGSVGDGDLKLNLIGTGGGKLYVNGSAGFWIGSQKTSVAEAAALADKWVTGIPSGMGIVGICDLATLVKSYTSQTVAQDAPAVVGTTTIGGQSAVNLRIKAGTTTVTLSVSASTPHYPLQIVASAGKRVTVFSNFNTPVSPSAPSGAQDLSKLKPAK